MIRIFKIEIKEKWFKLLFIQFYRKKYIELYYEYLENRIYYKDKNKDIATSKDLCRSVKMVYFMIKRLKAFNIEYKIKENNIDGFLIDLVKSNDSSIPSLIFGTQTFDIDRFLNYCDALELEINNLALLNQIYKESLNS